MTRAYTFTACRHEEFGEVGLRPDWYPTGEPFEGMAAAHDILEHFPGDDGSTKGELLALGASLFIRGETGYFNRGGSPHPIWAHISSEFPTLRGRPEWSVPICRYLPRVPDRVRDWTICVAEEAAKDTAYSDDQKLTDAEVAYIPKWLARGYSMARRRYRKIGENGAADLFGQIERGCNKALKYSEEGDTVRVVVNMRRCSARVEQVPRDYGD